MSKFYKIISKGIMTVFIMILCLQNTISFDELGVVLDDSHLVVVEFKNGFEFGQIDSTFESANKSFRLMYRGKEAFASPNNPYFWISSDSKLRAVKSDIKSTFLENKEGVWTINLVFNNLFSQKLLALEELEIFQKLAVVINSDLFNEPNYKNDLFKTINSDGEVIISIPTKFKSKQQIDRFMQQYNI